MYEFEIRPGIVFGKVGRSESFERRKLNLLIDEKSVNCHSSHFLFGKPSSLNLLKAYNRKSRSDGSSSGQ